jgi:hypothetical protein
MCISSYCDNNSLLNREEDFHARDTDSPSFYTKPNHNIIVTLSVLRTNLPLRFASLHGRDHQDETCDFDLLSLDPHNPMLLLATSLMMRSWMSVQLKKNC